VDHFSRYGLVDDEGSDGEAVVPTPTRLQSFRGLLFSNKAQSENVWQRPTVTEAIMSNNTLDLLTAPERLLDLQDSIITQDVNLLHNQSLSRILSSSSLWFDQVVESSI
jgi:hypothetical protein